MIKWSPDQERMTQLEEALGRDSYSDISEVSESLVPNYKALEDEILKIEEDKKKAEAEKLKKGECTDDI